MKIQYDATDEAKQLIYEVLNGDELDSYRLQLTAYVAAGRPLGRSHILIKRKPDPVWIDVLVSEKLQTIFPLMFHFNRKGEPTERYRRELEEYIQQIKNKEDP